MPAKRSSHPWMGCIRIPDFPVQAELARRPELRGRPVVITAPAAGGATAKTPVTHCSPEAAEQGVRPGMPVREVIATCREAVAFIPRSRVVPGAFTTLFSTRWKGGARRRRRRSGLGLRRSHRDGAPLPQGRPPFGAS